MITRKKDNKILGILNYGIYLPVWRIDRAEIAQSSGGASMGGERSVASWDEDSLTMGVEAGIDCLTGYDPKDIDGLYFASVSSPFKEKQAASIIASVLDLRKDIFTGDFTTCLRAATTAVKAAVDAVKAGSAKRVMVIAADRRNAEPKTVFEQTYGAGAVAVLIGENETIANIEDLVSISNPIPGQWQTNEDKFPKRFEPKLDRSYGLLKDVPSAITNLILNHNQKNSDINKFALYGPDLKSYRDLARVLKIDVKAQLQDPLFQTVGITGTPHCLLLFVSALEDAKANERIACASYGEGSDAFLVITTENLEFIKKKHIGIKHRLSKKMALSYGRFMDFGGMREIGSPSESLKASVVKYWRDQKWALSLYGMRCNKCGTLQYPTARCCMICGEKDNYKEVKIARRGKVFTYTHDYLLGPGLLPGNGFDPTTRVVADMEDGCRLWLEMTDHELKEVDINMPIETTFRLIHQKGGYRYYGWRVRPMRF